MIEKYLFVLLHLAAVGLQFACVILVKHYAGVDQAAQFILILTAAMSIGAVIDLGAVSALQWKLIQMHSPAAVSTRARPQTQPSAIANTAGIIITIIFAAWQLYALPVDLLGYLVCIGAGLGLLSRRLIASICEAFGNLSAAKLSQIYFPALLFGLSISMAAMHPSSTLIYGAILAASIAAVPLSYSHFDAEYSSRIRLNISKAAIFHSMGLWGLVAVCSTIQSNTIFTILSEKLSSAELYWVFLMFRLNGIISEIGSSALRAKFAVLKQSEMSEKSTRYRHTGLAGLIAIASAAPSIYFSSGSIYSAILFAAYFFVEFLATANGYFLLARGGQVLYRQLGYKACLIVGLIYLLPKSPAVWMLPACLLGASIPYCIYTKILVGRFRHHAGQ